jgi:hypothetical protein
MATYNKRGYKAPKEKEVNEGVEAVIIDDKDSTTAEVFSKLDETASRTEDWLKIKSDYWFSCCCRNFTIGYLGYRDLLRLLNKRKH